MYFLIINMITLTIPGFNIQFLISSHPCSFNNDSRSHSGYDIAYHQTIHIPVYPDFRYEYKYKTDSYNLATAEFIFAPASPVR